MGDDGVTRRLILAGLTSLPIAAMAGDGVATATTGPALRLRPPRLENPRVLVLGDADVGERREFHLRGPGRDWIVKLPADRYLSGSVILHGHDEARHIVMIGGGIMPAPWSDPGTMRSLRDGGWAAYAERGFAGATGGTFRFRIWERSYRKGLAPPSTRDLPWNAKPAEIKAALDEAAGMGAVFAVDGPDTPGGPWKIVPSARPLLGRPVLDGSTLTGHPGIVARNVFRTAAGVALRIKNWRGTFHCEGVHFGGPSVGDGINIQNPNADAIAQFANVHSAPHYHPFHDDWIHPDGAQFYLGPSLCRMENVDLVSLGGNGFIAQPMLAQRPRALENLHDWWFRNCHFRSIMDDRNGRAADASTACYRDHYPDRATGGFSQHWDTANVYLSRARASDGAILRPERPQKCYSYRGHDSAAFRLYESPPGEFFADPRRRRSGPGYISPGYGGPALPDPVARG